MCTPQAILNFLVATLREYKETGKSNSNKIFYFNTTSMISFQHGSNVRLSVRPCTSFSFSLGNPVFYADSDLTEDHHILCSRALVCPAGWATQGPSLQKRRRGGEGVARPAYRCRLSRNYPLPLVPESVSPGALLSHPYFCPHPQCVAQQVLLYLPVCVDRCQVRTARAPERCGLMGTQPGKQWVSE